MLGGAVLRQAPTTFSQEVSCADLSTLLGFHYLKGELTELKVHLFLMKKEKMKTLQENMLLLLT